MVNWDFTGITLSHASQRTSDITVSSYEIGNGPVTIRLGTALDRKRAAPKDGPTHKLISVVRTLAVREDYCGNYNKQHEPHRVARPLYLLTPSSFSGCGRTNLTTILGPSDVS
jgi:hypothetical protein